MSAAHSTYSKTDLRTMASDIAAAVDGKATHVFVGTWMDRAGLSIDIRFQSKTDGRRIVIHKWDDEATCTVRYITGNFWRGRDKAQEFANTADVTFAVDAIVPVIIEQVQSC